MKSGWLFSFIIMSAVFSCTSGNKNTEVAEQETQTAAKNTKAAASHLIGSFVGSFGDNKITLLITKVASDSVQGSSVVGGYNRLFSGTVKLAGSTLNVIAKEPGGEAHDGTFKFSLDTTLADVIKGSWEPFEPTAKIFGKQYTLNRKAFVYLKDSGVFPMASQRLLRDEDVDNMPKDDLEFMRNEIFARHGYCFKKKILRDMFEGEQWYVPNNTDVKNLLTDIERKNLSLIKKYEKYADEFGDEFGR